MKTVNTLLAIAVLALGATQLSCNVNDYCLHCGTGDGGLGSGDDDARDGGGDIDVMPDAACIPTGPEQCDGMDNDCNGLIDDGNVEHVGELCANQLGVCAGGTKICQGGELKCTKNPSPEICDNLDNNCNNMVDEGDPGGGGTCGTAQGECQLGVARCQAVTGCDQSPSCDNSLAGNNCCVKCTNWVDLRNQPEQCNAKDDNCNGLFDEGLDNLGDCTWQGATNEGLCNIGTLKCSGGVATCEGAVFPKFEICNNEDDDCDTFKDEIFNKNIDPLNCGGCTLPGDNHVCPAKSKTCVGGTNNKGMCTTNTDCPGGGLCQTNSQPCCGPLCGGSNPNGTCNFKCNVGFINLNGTASDGCEYKCSPTGNEECDGVDNDCDGNVDETGPTGITPPQNFCLQAGVCQGSTVSCDMVTKGWKCNYPASFEPSEVSCDGLDNDCDSNIDDSHPDRFKTCFDGQSEPSGPVDKGICIDQGILICNAADPDGPLVCARGENGLMCAIGNNTDDNGDGKVNDGCPAVGAPETGANCNDSDDDDGDQYVNDGCPTSTLPVTPPAASENCNAKDDDCDGKTDETTGGVLTGRDWVTLANGVQMMKYEASRPDSGQSTQGIGTTTVCSRQGVLPWTNVTYPQAQAACAALTDGNGVSLNARLCTESEWHHACAVVPTPASLTFSVSTAAAAVIEAEDYTSILHATVPSASESGAQCAAGNAVDDDTDGTVNDGCPPGGPGNSPETLCADNADQDGDGLINDGCPAIAAQTRAWVHDYTPGYSGISAMEAVQNTGTGSVAIGQAPTQSPKLSYALNVTQASATSYHVWLKMYQTGLATNNVKAYVQLDSGALATVTLVPTPGGTGACTQDNECTALTGGVCSDLDANLVKDHCTGWAWVDAGAFNPTVGNHTLTVYMGDDGVKIDKVAIKDGTVAPADSATPDGNVFAYSTSPDTPNDTTCNAHERVPANDDVIATGTLPMCFADNAGATDIFDMSGNVKEWTKAQQPQVNPLRGGASNSTTAGTACALNFTVADDDLQFPNIGFRCCR